MLNVRWTDREGAWRLRNFVKRGECSKFLSTLRRPATVYEDYDREVGGVEYLPGAADDRRIKWAWWLED